MERFHLRASVTWAGTRDGLFGLAPGSPGPDPARNSYVARGQAEGAVHMKRGIMAELAGELGRPASSTARPRPRPWWLRARRCGLDVAVRDGRPMSRIEKSEPCA